MSYIKSYGIAFPQFRIEDCVLHPKGRKGVMKAVCYPDEDIITLAFESANKIPKESIDGIFFATATPVFHNRYHASFIADRLNLSPGILALDFTMSSRSGTDALLLANELINSGKYMNILVIASDAHYPEIGRETSTPFGHGACSVLLSNEKGFAEISSSNTVSSSFAEEFIYKGEYIQFDPRFSRDAGFKTNLVAALKTLDSSRSSFDSVIVNSLYSRMAGPFFAKAGFEERQFSNDVIINKTGNTGTAHALFLLLNDLELEKKEILLADYTNGTNLFKIKNNLPPEHKPLQEQINNYDLVRSYQDYLIMRKAGDFNSPGYHTKEMFSSEMMQEREKESLLYLKGLKCESCGTIYYLKSAQCKKCKRTTFSEVQLKDTGTVYAITNEHYFPASFPPISMVVVDLDGGGRMTVQQTDTMYPDKNEIKIGSKVKLVLRKMIENDAKPNYFWKAKQL